MTYILPTKLRIETNSISQLFMISNPLDWTRLFKFLVLNLLVLNPCPTKSRCCRREFQPHLSEDKTVPCYLVELGMVSPWVLFCLPRLRGRPSFRWNAIVIGHCWFGFRAAVEFDF